MMILEKEKNNFPYEQVDHPTPMCLHLELLQNDF